MENLINTLVLGAVVTAVFPIAFLAARLCLKALVRTLAERQQQPAHNARS